MISNKPKILLVDDEVDTLEFLSYHLKKNGFEIQTAGNGEIALNVLKKFNPDLILLDYMMPELDGLSFLKKFKEYYPKSNTLVALLTAKSEDEAQIQTLNLGADDFITKPIKPMVLLSRINALLRRKQTTESLKENQSINIDDLKIIPESFAVFLGDQELIFPRKEFQLLYLLANKPGKVFKRDEILQKIWGDEVMVGERTVDVHIRKIREKLNERFIKTIKGIGYKFEF